MSDLTDSEVLETVAEHLTPETLVTGWGEDGSDAGCILHHVAKADQMTLYAQDRETQVERQRPRVVKALFNNLLPNAQTMPLDSNLTGASRYVYQANDTEVSFDQMLQAVKGATSDLREEGY